MPPWRPWTVLTEVFIFYLLGLDCEGQKEVKVTRGEDATLECYGPSDATEILLRWSKPNHKIQGYVIYLKDGHFQEHLQDPSFKGRVKPKDSKWMKNGNFSVILQNVTINDSARYICEAGYNKKEVQILNNIILTVEEPGQPGGQSGDGGKEDGGEKSGSVGLIVGLSVSAVLLVAVVVGFLIYNKHKQQQSQASYQPPVELQPV